MMLNVITHSTTRRSLTAATLTAGVALVAGLVTVTGTASAVDRAPLPTAPSVVEVPPLAPQADAAATTAEVFASDAASYGSLRAAAPTLASGSAPTTTSSAPSAATPAGFPRLSSRSGSTRTLYLNFVGGTVSGTGWNSGKPVTVRPYDTDGRPTSWSAAESAVVTEVYRRVVEDYAPFDVNVTTVNPGADRLNRTSSADTTFGATVMVSGETFYASTCKCGGIAYTGGFGMVGNDKYNEAWVFTRAVGKGARNIAEATTHESGHTLGLSHDSKAGTTYFAGQGAWAPVMGSAYSRPVTQFSRGEYSGATNKESDLSIITGTGGLALVADEAGSTTGTATALSVGQARSAVVAASNDLDTYRVSLPRKATTVTANVAAVGPNLDVAITLIDARGKVVATANPAVTMVNANSASGLSASLKFTPAAAGTYYVRIQGVGFGTAASSGYSTYGSVGYYSVRVAQ